MPFKKVAGVGKGISKRKKEKVELPAKKRAVSVFDVVMENITTRRSVRKFLKRDVSMADIYKLLDAARHAPSEGNQQPWEFIIVKDKKMKETLAEAAHGEELVIEAPVVIVACINMKIAGAVYGERGLKLYAIQSVAAAIENLMLAANAMGLGTNWVGAFSEPKVAVPLRCPEHVRPAALILVGWPAEAPKKPERHEIADFAHLEEYGKTPRAAFVWGHGHVED